MSKRISKTQKRKKKRKSPIKHKVQSHKRKGRQVSTYTRGKGTSKKFLGTFVEKKRIIKKPVSVLKKGITFSEYEDITQELEKLGGKKIKGLVDVGRYWSGGTYRIDSFEITVAGNSLFEGGEMEVKAPSRKIWKEFLSKHKDFVDMLPPKGTKLIFLESEERWVRY